MSIFETLVSHNAAAHRSIERLFGRLAVVAREGSVSRAALDAGIAAGLQMLHAHHTMEDVLLVPRLSARGLQAANDVVRDHAHIEELSASLKGGAAGKAEKLDRLVDILGRHQAQEEELLDVSGWGALFDDDAQASAFGKEVAKMSRAGLKPAAKLLPLLLYNLSPDERARFTAKMPKFVVNGLVPYAFRPAWRPLRPFMVFPPARLAPWA